MKYEIEIPEGRYCDECLMLNRTFIYCALNNTALEIHPATPPHYLKDAACPAYHGEVIRQGLMGRVKP